MNIHVTDQSVAKVLELMEVENDPNLRLRIYVMGGGCSGLQYGFAFDNKLNEEEDKVATIESKDAPGSTIQIVVDYMSYSYLKDSTVDYVQNLQGAHFTITNPNATTTCGCGNSFSV